MASIGSGHALMDRLDKANSRKRFVEPTRTGRVHSMLQTLEIPWTALRLRAVASDNTYHF